MSINTFFTFMRTVAFLAAVAMTSAGCQDQWPLGFYDEEEGRRWERIVVPDATCGNGTEYAFFFSPSSRPMIGNDRLTVYFQGGGSTLISETGALNSAIKSLATLDEKLNVPAEYTGANRLFMDRHPENDAFIGPGHWAFFPYCTQDAHSGRRVEAYAYDFTNAEGRLRQEVERQLNGGKSVHQIETEHPGLEIAAWHEDPPGTFHVDRLLVHILHRGGLNVERANEILFQRIRNENPQFRLNAKVLVSGGSAGGFGAWYNFYLYADYLYPFPDSRMTLAPMGGSPTERVWNDAVEDLVIDDDQVAALDARLDWWETIRPCEAAGGAYTPTGDEDCDDVLNLLDHYRLERYPDRDNRYMMMVNKEDNVRVSSFRGDPHFDEKLLNLCKTIHRYAQHLHTGRREDTVVYAAWQFNRLHDGSLKRVHVPDYGTILTHMLRPDGSRRPSPFNLLGLMNAVAGRTFSGEPIHIEQMPNIVENPMNPDSPVTAYTDHLDEMAECNVPWP